MLPLPHSDKGHGFVVLTSRCHTAERVRRFTVPRLYRKRYPTRRAPSPCVSSPLSPPAVPRHTMSPVGPSCRQRGTFLFLIGETCQFLGYGLPSRWNRQRTSRADSTSPLWQNSEACASGHVPSILPGLRRVTLHATSSRRLRRFRGCVGESALTPSVGRVVSAKSS